MDTLRLGDPANDSAANTKGWNNPRQAWPLIAAAVFGFIVLAIMLWPTSLGSFTIKPGDTLIEKVGDYSKAIDLAERHGLKIMATPLGGTAYPISPQLARQLEDHTDVILVDPQVFPGDFFDLDAGTYVSPRNLTVP